jgi:hypothetical protein
MGAIANKANLRIGSTYEASAREYWQGTMQEIVVYNTDQTSNTSGIRSNINTFYSIY